MDRIKTVMGKAKRTTLNDWEEKAIQLALEKSFKEKSLETAQKIKDYFSKVCPQE